MKNELEKVDKKVRSILKKANEIVIEAFKGESKIIDKGGVQLSTSILTETDEKLDIFLRQALKKAFPRFGFITEEGLSDLKQYNWIIDPIDGTANFAHRIPIFGISIALWKQDEPKYGIILFPLLKETLHAISGNGAFNNKGKIQQVVSQRIHSKPYVVCASVCEDAIKQQIYKKIYAHTAFPVNFLCATYHFALIIQGKVDYALFINLSIWDIAAGLLIAKEAGLKCQFISKGPSIFSADFRAYNKSFVISRQGVSQDLIKNLKYTLKACKS